MSTQQILCTQWLPAPLESVFEFFSNAENLQAITPPWLGFEILTPVPIQMQPGTLIDYRVRLHGFPMLWKTLITVWEPPFRFVDLQLKGPYSLWHHEHLFESKDGGTLVTDRVDYRIPFSWMPGSSLIDRFLVRPDLDRIFGHRQKVLAERFPGAPNACV